MLKLKLSKKTTLFLKYSLVGFSGVLVDVGILAFLVEIVKTNVLIGNVFSFFLATLNNYTWNRLWTFRSKELKVLRQYFKFVLVSLGGILISTALLYVLIYQLHLWYLAAKLLTIVMIGLWNFLLNKNWTFIESL